MKTRSGLMITLFVALVIQSVSGGEGWQVNTPINVNVTVYQYK
jgi:hypothetical protein